MTWTELEALLNSETLRLSSTRPDIDGHPSLDTLDLHKRTKRSVDTAIAEFSESREWPELDAQSRLMVLERLQFAQRIVNQLSLGGTSLSEEPAAVGDSELIRSILIEAWEDPGNESPSRSDAKQPKQKTF